MIPIKDKLRKLIFDLTYKYDRRKCTLDLERKYNRWGGNNMVKRQVIFYCNILSGIM